MYIVVKATFLKMTILTQLKVTNYDICL